MPYNLLPSKIIIRLPWNAPQGAGIQTAQHVVDRGARVLITGNLGPKAFKVLHAAGVAVFTSNASSAQKAIDEYKNNQLSQLPGPNVQGHWE
ncbi:MAG: Dinitrogenase iron-molybdenum cofactor [Candidatus Kentron sp. G]|nr:MAG: Dinitrogenase iron-molybdenum cofactor [Candidatus Kentron sp. G]VFN04794.1 MAG: Dinitrogenase iron-molybdenum cofactor [Candidatus Kentron sp. G]VFN05997.1 MAG: Dinitrogenase iron-molybdenum cofactor [Candidatus Kentron sp. G]